VSDVTIIQDLIDTGTVSQVLRRESPQADAVRALQRMLHVLGFAHELRWEERGDDGQYGSATAAAVGAFAGRNGLGSDGESVSESVAEALLSRDALLPHLERLRRDVDSGSVEPVYRRKSPHVAAVQSLQHLLNALGFGEQLKWSTFGADGDYGGGTTKAVEAFASSEGLPGDGTVLTTAMAQRLVARAGAWYGEAWREAQPAPVSVSGLLVRELVRNSKPRVSVSDGQREKTFARLRKGLATLGNCPPAEFLVQSHDALRQSGVSEAALTMLLATAENEGNLDAINSYDNAFLSFGMFQWTAGTGGGRGELAALLERVRADAPQDFDACFGQHGIGTSGSNATNGWLTLDGTRLQSAAAKEQLRSPAWAFRFWLAGQDTAVQSMEVRHALARLERFYDTDSYRVARRYRVSELVSSQYGVALLLDQHVNRPAHVKGCLGQALNQLALGDPGLWTTAEETRLLDAYLVIRRNFGSSPMTDSDKRAAVTRRFLDTGRLSGERGSFGT